MKRFMNKKSLLTATLLMTMSVGFGGYTAAAATPAAELAKDKLMANSTISELTDDTRTFKVDRAIDTKKVTFQNHYGFDVAGHMYLPKDFNNKKEYAAVVITGPFGAVKEQASGRNWQKMASWPSLLTHPLLAKAAVPAATLALRKSLQKMSMPPWTLLQT